VLLILGHGHDISITSLRNSNRCQFEFVTVVQLYVVAAHFSDDALRSRVASASTSSALFVVRSWWTRVAGSVPSVQLNSSPDAPSPTISILDMNESSTKACTVLTVALEGRPPAELSVLSSAESLAASRWSPRAAHYRSARPTLPPHDMSARVGSRARPILVHLSRSLAPQRHQFRRK
jgi:hypothetical protein